MKSVVFVLGMASILMTAGCVGSDSPRMNEIELTETQKLFKTNTTFKNGVIEVEARRRNGSSRTLNSASNLEYEWGLYLPPPPIPGFVSREYLLSENRHDGRTLLYTAVEWDEENPLDYLAVGWWLHYPPGVSTRRFEEAERGVFIDGPELDLSNPPEMPMGGEATYAGGVGGLYEYRYGSGWGELQGESQYIEFTALIGLRANFSDATIMGCIGCAGDIETQALHLFPIVTWRTPDPDALPTDYQVHFGPSPFDADGTFENTDITVTHPERTVVQTTGLWAGQFSNVPDPDGNPRRVVGFTDVDFDEADRSSGTFMGIFSALTSATLAPEDRETP